MSIIASDNGGGDFELIPEDQHIARCILIADIGTQDGDFGPKRQVILGWELPEVRRTFDETKGEEPAMISKFYTLSLNEKANLRHDLESWRGKSFSADELAGFDIENLAGVPCLLQVNHKAGKDGTVRAKVASIAKIPKGMTVPDLELPIKIYSVAAHDEAVYASLPEWIQKRIDQSTQRAISGKTATAVRPELGDEIPF